MTDANEQEFGNAASKVRLQDEVGKIKNRQGEACIEITDDENVGIGTSTPRRKLDILDASAPQLRVSQADDSVYADVEAKSTGGVHITPTGGTYAGHAFLKSGSASSYLVAQNSTTGNTDDRTKGLTVGVGGDIAYVWMRGTGPGDTNCSLNIGAGGTGGLTLDADNDIVALEGSFQLKAEIAAPSAPAANEGGIFYVKDDGIPYYISNTTAETSLVGGSGGGTTTTGGTLITADPAPAVAGTMYLCNAASAFNVTLPTAAAAGNGGTIDVCKASGANDITVLRAGSDTINGAASLVVSVLYGNVTLISDGGTKWYIR